jgi:methionyl aminopeptidase
MGFRDRGIEIKTPEQIDLMRVAGRLVGETLELLRAAVRPGVSTLELDTLAETNIRDHGGVPSFKGYSHPPFPATICASVNDEVVHGIPGQRTLAEGDVISIDCGAIVEGWLGGRVGDISHAVETHVRSQGRYGILEDYTGHGIGTEMHMPPNVPNVGRRGRGPSIVEGLALAVEPMVTLGSKHTDLLEDEWTVATVDGSVAAHFEHTFTVTPQGAWVLTAVDGGQAGLAALGVPFGGR